MELGTGSSVNSGSKCRRSLGPVCMREEGAGRQAGISQPLKYLTIVGNVLSEDVSCSLVTLCKY